MKSESKTAVRYEPRRCTILQRTVWAIMTQHPNGEWRIVNCLDKDEGCFSLECVFTTDHGQWPYLGASASPGGESHA